MNIQLSVELDDASSVFSASIAWNTEYLFTIYQILNQMKCCLLLGSGLIDYCTKAQRFGGCCWWWWWWWLPHQSCASSALRLCLSSEMSATHLWDVVLTLGLERDRVASGLQFWGPSQFSWTAAEGCSSCTVMKFTVDALGVCFQLLSAHSRTSSLRGGKWSIYRFFCFLFLYFPRRSHTGLPRPFLCLFPSPCVGSDFYISTMFLPINQINLPWF